MTDNSNEGLLAEINRLRDDVQKQADWADWAKDELERLTSILAALREPSESIMFVAYLANLNDTLFDRAWTAALRAAVTAAEQEVERE